MSSIRAARCVVVLLAIVGITAVPAAAQVWIPTNTGNGADAEVRESTLDQNRGDSTELATRVRNDFAPPDLNDGTDRNSLFYMRFDLGAVMVPADLESGLRLTYRNNNLTGSRIQDTVTPDPSVRTGLMVYGLDPMAAGVSWGELTITYNNAPGLTPDGSVGTRDINGDLIPLGTVLFPQIGSQNHLPVGGELIFQSAALDQFVADVVNGGDTEVTLAAHVIHDGSAPFDTWLNFNYLFNPKEQTTLNTDNSYDSDINNPPDAEGSPWSGADNSTGDFSPSLLIQEATPVEPPVAIPAMPAFGLPLLAVLLGLAAVLGLRRRRTAAAPGGPDPAAGT